MKSRNIEQRVSELEAEMSALRQALGVKNGSGPWWERIAGTFDKDLDYQKAMKLGKQYRNSLKPRKQSRRKP